VDAVVPVERLLMLRSPGRPAAKEHAEHARAAAVRGAGAAGRAAWLAGRALVLAVAWLVLAAVVLAQKLPRPEPHPVSSRRDVRRQPVSHLRRAA
jgi:hypothetical protein